MKIPTGTISYPPAVFSDDEIYRYTLWRTRAEPLLSVAAADFRPAKPKPSGYVNFICLNPSVASDTQDDPTIRKITKFAYAWGYNSVCITNIFAYRSTDPKILTLVSNPEGDENNRHIRRIAESATIVVAAWSQHANIRRRSEYVRRMLLQSRVQLHYLKMGKVEPYHPLYLPDDTKPVIWTTNN